jgi:hypothetical protein
MGMLTPLVAAAAYAWYNSPEKVPRTYAGGARADAGESWSSWVGSKTNQAFEYGADVAKRSKEYIRQRSPDIVRSKLFGDNKHQDPHKTYDPAASPAFESKFYHKPERNHDGMQTYHFRPPPHHPGSLDDLPVEE